MIVARVPASTANLGPGFDALGMALSVYAEIGPLDREAPTAGYASHVVDERHPADVAFRVGGGEGPLWVRSTIPVGRGLGFSGAMRVGGLLAASAQRTVATAAQVVDRAVILRAAMELEGHADNAAASLFGGVVATAGGIVVPVALAIEPAVVTWVPASGTSTQKSRGALPANVAFRDAVFNVGRTALLVAALAAGDVGALRTATEDRLHQDLRFAATAPSREALAAGLEAGAWAGWLSGSGPTVALLCDPSDAARLAADLAARLTDGHAKVLQLDTVGATIEER